MRVGRQLLEAVLGMNMLPVMIDMLQVTACLSGIHMVITCQPLARRTPLSAQLSSISMWEASQTLSDAFMISLQCGTLAGQQ